VKFVDIKVFFVENVKILKPSLIFWKISEVS
jgi:hypothetical protein